MSTENPTLVSNPHKCEDCYHEGIEVSPHFLFRCNAWAARCMKCLNFWVTKDRGLTWERFKDDQDVGCGVTLDQFRAARGFPPVPPFSEPVYKE